MDSKLFYFLGVILSCLACTNENIDCLAIESEAEFINIIKSTVIDRSTNLEVYGGSIDTCSFSLSIGNGRFSTNTENGTYTADRETVYINLGKGPFLPNDDCLLTIGGTTWRIIKRSDSIELEGIIDSKPSLLVDHRLLRYFETISQRIIIPKQ